MTKEPATKPTTEWGKWKTWTSTTDLRKSELIKIHCDFFDSVCIGLYICVTSHAYKSVILWSSSALFWRDWLGKGLSWLTIVVYSHPFWPIRCNEEWESTNCGANDKGASDETNYWMGQVENMDLHYWPPQKWVDKNSLWFVWLVCIGLYICVTLHRYK